MIDRKQKIKELLDNIHSIKRVMDFQAPKSLKDEYTKITPSQWGVIMFIEKNKDKTVKDIAEYLNMTSSAVTQLVNALVRNGYVIRRKNVNDRRIVVLSLSKKTMNKVENMKKRALVRFLEFFEGLNDREFGQYISLNNKIVKSLLNKKEHKIS